MPSDLPAHASPALPPISSDTPPSTHLSRNSSIHSQQSRTSRSRSLHHAAPTIHSPRPPEHADLGANGRLPRPGQQTSILNNSDAAQSTPHLLDTLPTVSCIVRARIPTVNGQDMYLYLYHNNVDSKEHLAIVFGEKIRSRSLYAEKEGESELARMIRGAYTGRLYPGRTDSHQEAPSPHQNSGHNAADVSLRQSTSGRSSVLSRDAMDNVYHEPESSPNALPHTPLQPPAGPSPANSAPLVRIHSECYTGETVWSARCDCGEQLDEAARLMSDPANAEAGGVIIYLKQEGRGIGLSEKLKAYNLQDLGSDTVEANLLLRHPADARSYGLATAMLVDLGLGRDSNESRNSTTADSNEQHDIGGRGIRLLTNNPEKIRAVEGPNREVIVRERVPMVPLAWSTKGERGIKGEEFEKYLHAKIELMGHNLVPM